MQSFRNDKEMTGWIRTREPHLFIFSYYIIMIIKIIYLYTHIHVSVTHGVTMTFQFGKTAGYSDLEERRRVQNNVKQHTENMCFQCH